MMIEHDILVRGTGAVGLAAALALSRQGLRVALQGDAPAAPATADVRAYALNAASVQLLREVKVWDALPADTRTQVHEMHIQGDDPAGEAPGMGGGAGTLEFSAWTQGVAELAWIVDAAALEQALRAAVGFAPHITWMAAAEAAPAAALQVLAEGKASTTRHALGVQWTRHAYGHQGIAARLSSDRPHNGVARQWFRSPDVLALLPLDKPQPGCGYGLVWSVPHDRAQQLLALGDADFCDMLMQATGGAAGSLHLASERAQWPLAVAEADAVHGAGWVLIGDAAHVVHPLAGQGLNLGLADVAALAQVLAGRESWRSLGDVRLLARYARQRWAPTRAMARVTDGLLHLFAARGPVAHILRNKVLGLVNKAGPLKRLLINRALGT
jgi:ubiquinone biosynthesis UbiH/UbiF/VisC/COQ6 family hydroxylase